MQAIALVDYDNVDPPRPNRSREDIEIGLDSVTDALVAYVKEQLHGYDELYMRLYGGWLTERNQLTQRGQDVTGAATFCRGLRSGVRVLPILTTSLAVCSDRALIGTFRTGRGATGQKMVDTMLSVDAIHFSSLGRPCVLIVSDDDDMVPAAISASKRSVSSVHLLRVRENGRGLNDNLCTSAGTKIGTHKIQLRAI